METAINMTINDMLPETVTKLTNTMILPGFQGDMRSIRFIQTNLFPVIDKLGEQSAAAQGLSKVITTSDKMLTSPTYTLYLLKDPHSNRGKGEVIGILKVGTKHLYLTDEQKTVHELEPLCVLDFYVVQDKQRHGYGRMLFDYMLNDMKMPIHHLAIDGPSAKMEQFLAKNYGADKLVRHSNNFAVSPRFFHDIDKIQKSGATPTVSTPVGRYAARKPHSTIANVIHGGGTYHSGASSESPEAEVEVEAPAAEAPETEAPEAARSSPPAPSALERPCTLPVAALAPPAGPAPPAHSPVGSSASRRDSQLTDKGFFDVKFYHNKLW